MMNFQKNIPHVVMIQQMRTVIEVSGIIVITVDCSIIMAHVCVYIYIYIYIHRYSHIMLCVICIYVYIYIYTENKTKKET